mgnify:CR=1 FL=1
MKFIINNQRKILLICTTGLLLLIGLFYYLKSEHVFTQLFSEPKFEWENQPKKLSANEKKMAADLSNFFYQKARNTNFNANVLVAYHGKVLFSDQFGIFSPVTKKLLTDSSTFQLASASKPFTATAVLQLFENGKLNLDDPLQKFFPDLNYPGITIKTMLCHRSGLPNYIYFMDSLAQLQPDSFFTNAQVVEYMIKHHPPISFQPDTHFQYCNTNYALLAAIVEQVSDETFQEYVEENIFKVAHMQHSYICNRPEEAVRSNETRGYKGSRWNLEVFTPYDGVVGDKGVYSTAWDMFLFHEALNNGILLKKEILELAYRGNSFEKSGHKNYGFGWRINQVNNNLRLIYHNGWWKGYNVLFARNVDDDFVIIVLSNHYNRSVYELKPILDLLRFGSPADSIDTEE